MLDLKKSCTYLLVFFRTQRNYLSKNHLWVGKKCLRLSGTIGQTIRIRREGSKNVTFSPFTRSLGGSSTQGLDQISHKRFISLAASLVCILSKNNQVEKKLVTSKFVIYCIFGFSEKFQAYFIYHTLFLLQPFPSNRQLKIDIFFNFGGLWNSKRSTYRKTICAFLS